MAETTTAPNNKPVAFGQKVTREPSGIAKVRAPSGAAKSAVIRKKAKGAINKGMISEKAAKKYLGNV
jgi:hypothetical protein